MKKFSLVGTVLLLLCTASAGQVSGIVESSPGFGTNLEKTYSIGLDLPTGFKSKVEGGVLKIEQGATNRLGFSMVSAVPTDSYLGDQHWVVSDTTAQSEVFHSAKIESGNVSSIGFALFRRLNPNDSKLLLRCGGVAQDRQALEAMLNICRSAKLQ